MLKNLKSILCSLLPIIVFVSFVHFFIYEFETETYFKFLIGSAMLVCGQVFFLNGIDNSVVSMGEFVGNSITSMKTFWIYIVFAIVFGTFSTIAEPDLLVFANRVVFFGFPIHRTVFLFLAGAGVGLFMAFALIRIVKKIPLQYVFLVFIAVIFVLALFVDETTYSMILDSGTSVAGVITSPFLLALGLGVSRIVAGRDSEDGSFGMITICSFGAIIALLLYFVFANPTKTFVATEGQEIPLVLSTLKDVSLSLFPLVLIFFVFEFFVIKISKQDKLRLMIGVAITFVGFYLFVFAIEFGMVDMGNEFGDFLAKLNNVPLACLICAFMGFFVVFCEPAIRILADQIEEVTHGNLRSKLVLPVIAISIVLALVLIVVKFVYDVSIWWFVGIIFGGSLLIMPFIPKFFTPMSFDAGGVATGTITVAFIFPIMTGFSGSPLESFGVLAILAFVPILVMQVLGLVYRLREEKDDRRTRKIFLRLSKTDDEFSNIDKMKERHNELMQGGSL